VSAPTVLGLIGSILILAVLFELLRRRHLREKYAVTWAAVAVGVLVLTVFPGLLYAASDLVGVDVPANLLFFMASMVLMVLTLQHSFELGRLEDKTRTLAEELALLRLEVDRLRVERDQPAPDPSHDPSQ
jgi:hypothetical protein